MQRRYYQRKVVKSSKLNHEIKRLAKLKCNPQKLVETFEKMKQDGFEYDDITYLIAQKASIKIHCQNKEIHQAEKLWNGIITNDEYKYKLTLKDYSIIIGIFLDGNYTQSAMNVFDEMLKNGSKPDLILYNLIIKVATNLKSLEKAQEIHELMIQEQPDLIQDNVMQNHLVNMYLKCGDMYKAQLIFQSIKVKTNTDIWNILLNGMIDDHKYQEAMNLFQQMIKQNISPDDMTYSCIFKAISKTACSKEANKFYQMIQNDVNINIYDNIVICNSLITMFGKCGCIDKAIEIWTYLENNKPNSRNIRTWNAMMNVYLFNGDYQEILDLYHKLMTTYHGKNRLSQKLKIQPQVKTFCICIEACTHLGNIEIAEQIYNEIQNLFSYINNPILYNSLIDMFCKCDGLDKGIKIWREMMSEGTESVAKFTFMMKLCIKYGNNMKAFELFDEMQNVYRLKPDATTYGTILKACKGHEKLIRKMHEEITLAGKQYENDTYIVSTLISAYNACGNKTMANDLWKQYQIVKKNKL